MNGRIVAAVCNRHALFETWPGGCNPPPRDSSASLRTGETPNPVQLRILNRR
jgi:hypothetical protein